MLLLADAQLQAGKTDDAKRGYQKLLQIDRDNVQIIGRLGKLELAIGNFGEASFQLEKAVKLNPSDKSLYGPLARAYRGAGNSNRAVANLLVAVPYEYQLWQQSQNSLKPKVEQDELRAQYFADLGALAQLQYESGDNEQSVETCQRWVEQDPTNAEAHYSLGRACIAAGLVFDGEKALAEAVKLDPKREAYSATLQDAQKLKDQAKVSAHEITIAEFKLNDLYPSLYRNYADAKSLPIGELVIANNGSVAIVGASLTVFQSQLMSEPTSVKCPTLLPFSNNRIKLNAIFTDKILDFTTDTKLQMVAEVQYKDGKGTAKLTKAAPLTVHGRNAISWSDKRRLAAFVEPNAEYLIRFVQAVDQVYQSEPTNGLNKRLLHAAQIYTLLRQLQWSYRPDPLQSFATVSTQTEIMDYLQFPAETMQRKSGDCDDLVTAMAAMLEAAGIPTAYIDVPGHVFLAFDTGIKPSEMSANGIGPVDAIVNDDKVWIPLETTLVGSQPFVVAWKSAGERYYAEVKAGHFPEVVSLSDARQLYLPATFIPNDYQMQLPNYAEVEKAYGEVMMQLIAKTRKQAIAELEARYIAEPNNVFVKNKYATLLAQIGDLDRAERILLEALALSPGSASVLNNLGNVYLLKKEGSKAVDYYTQASGQDVADAEIIINLCKANLLAGNLTKARELFDKAVELNNNIANRYEHLKLQLK
jgi:Flp pilus assembly protein TadD